MSLDAFRQIWCVDAEFTTRPGERPDPVCLVAWELRSDTKLRLWADELKQRRLPPYSIGADSLVIAYFASAELGCHLALGWPLPVNVLDLYVEFRNLVNGRDTPCGAGLLGALSWYGLDSLSVAEKEDMRALALRGGPWTEAERAALLEYCETDVRALAVLLPRMLPTIDLPRALLRARYMSAVARMEHTGVPIDLEMFGRLQESWEVIRDELIRSIDVRYGVFDGRTFRRELFARWLIAHNIAWPQLPSGALALDEETFRSMAKAHPELQPLHELRTTLSQMRLADLAVGSDGRNRTLLSPFRTKTGRNAPSNSKFVFGPATWIRGLIKPAPDHALAYIDWSQQEFGIAAVLSDDSNMLAAYQTGDPYLALAIQAGAAPPDATKTTHKAIREAYKIVVLGVQYGMGETRLALQLGVAPVAARKLLRDHRHTYCKFWEWTDGASAAFNLGGKVWTVFGWVLHNGCIDNANTERTVRNFPVQANAAEMMRLAAIRMTEAGIPICAPVHDAFLIEAPLEDLEQTVTQARRLMAAASRDVLNGFELASDVTCIRYPGRYADPRGGVMWETVTKLLPAHQRAPMRVDAPRMCADAL